jgi:hypothetical protein
VLFSLCGVNTIVTNHWATKPEDNLKIFEELLAGSLSEGIYLGGSVKKSWNRLQTEIESDQEAPMEKRSRNRVIFRHNTVTYGLPIVRIV